MYLLISCLSFWAIGFGVALPLGSHMVLIITELREPFA